MMGGHHAACGAAVWVGVTATAPTVAALHWMQLEPGYTALGALLCAGAALLPDADHPQATVAHSAGAISKEVTETVGDLAGGHRHGTHSLLAAILLTLAAAACWQFHLIHPGRFTIAWWVCLAVVSVLAAFALKVLGALRSWAKSWFVGVLIGTSTCLLWPGFLPLLPAVIIIGVWTHLAGDLLTTGGLPITWPLNVPGPSFIPDRIWGKNGYFALPVLGNAGSFREWLLCIPILLYALWGVGASIYALLPS